MKVNNWVLIIGVVGVAILILCFIEIKKRKAEEEKNKRIEEENLKLRKSHLLLSKKYIEATGEIPSEIINQLKSIAISYQEIDSKISEEINGILKLLDNKMDSKAIGYLAKVIENLLKDEFAEDILKGQYRDENQFETKKKKITFHRAIEFAKEKSFINDEESYLSHLLRKIRNQEFHELSNELGKNWEKIALLGGINIILKFNNLNLE